jgi:hypothetical protein
VKDYLLAKKFEKRYVEAVADNNIDNFVSEESTDMFNHFDEKKK